MIRGECLQQFLSFVWFGCQSKLSNKRNMNKIRVLAQHHQPQSAAMIILWDIAIKRPQSQANATLAPQAKASGKNLNYATLALQVSYEILIYLLSCECYVLEYDHWSAGAGEAAKILELNHLC